MHEVHRTGECSQNRAWRADSTQAREPSSCCTEAFCLIQATSAVSSQLKLTAGVKQSQNPLSQLVKRLDWFMIDDRGFRSEMHLCAMHVRDEKRKWNTEQLASGECTKRIQNVNPTGLHSSTPPACSKLSSADHAG